VLRKLTSIAVSLMVLISSPVRAYESETHREIAERAARPSVSLLDQALRAELGLPGGIDQTFPGRSRPGPRTVARLIGDGAEAEDIPVERTINHFHNPLQPWDQAGLSVLAFGGQSSVLWQQNPSQDLTTVRVGPLSIRAGGGNHSWQDARRHYLNALRGEIRDDRATAFAEMFETLGYLTHLIQDASVPAHTRNDSHLPILDPEGYEKHVEELRAAPANSRDRTMFESALNRDPVRPPGSIFTLTGDPRAPVPIARLIDTDTFGGQNFEVLTLTNIGVAEYTNGNFLSDDTIFSDFALPRRGSLGADFFEPEGDKLRRYFEKVGEGQGIRHFVAESTLYDPVNAELGRPMNEGLVLTRRVYEDYAAQLLPRAVGYSAALLDYFFRGTLDFTIGGSSPNQTLTITNKSDEAMEGTFTLYADNFSDVRTPVAGASFNLTLGSGATSGALNFTPPAEAQAYTLVFHGKLGNEDGAVAARVSEWYTVTDVTPGTITAGQATTVKITVKSNFSLQPRPLVAGLFAGNAVKLASTSALIPNNGPTTTQMSLDITSTTIPNIAPRPLSLVVGTDADIATITRADLRNQVPVNTMNLVRVGEASRLPIYQRLVTPQLLRVLAFPQSSILLTCTILGLEPETITLKFKNAENFTIQYLATSADHEPQSNFKNLTFDGSQTEFQTVTLKLDNLVNESGQRAVNHILQMFGDLLTTDAFVCIQSFSGVPDLIFGNCSFGDRWTLRECPE